MRHTYGLNLERSLYYAIYLPEYCDICEKHEDVVGPMVYEHCHETGEHRGWVCQPCNKMMGHARDNPKTLRNGAEYFENPPGESNGREWKERELSPQAA